MVLKLNSCLHLQNLFMSCFCVRVKVKSQGHTKVIILFSITTWSVLILMLSKTNQNVQLSVPYPLPHTCSDIITITSKRGSKVKRRLHRNGQMCGHQGQDEATQDVNLLAGVNRLSGLIVTRLWRARGGAGVRHVTALFLSPYERGRMRFHPARK